MRVEQNSECFEGTECVWGLVFNVEGAHQQQGVSEIEFEPGGLKAALQRRNRVDMFINRFPEVITARQPSERIGVTVFRQLDVRLSGRDLEQ